MSDLKFKKVIENFKCGNCGEEVSGDGYTNHCPHCLYSKHVDINPGDRAHTCGGLMKPVGTEERGGELRVIQKCIKCGEIHKNRVSSKDNFDEVVAISKNRAENN